jgi:hypothetical protein
MRDTVSAPSSAAAGGDTLRVLFRRAGSVFKFETGEAAKEAVFGCSQQLEPVCCWFMRENDM